MLPLSQYADRLASYHRHTAMSPQLQSLCQDMLERGLPDIPVSHPTDRGLPVPVEGFEDQRIYVWAERVPDYFASFIEALGESGEAADWRSLWNRPDTELVQFFAFDNGYFHTVLRPGVISGSDAFTAAQSPVAA